MVGITVVTHGKFAEGICNSVELIAGPQSNLTHIGLFEGDDMAEFKANIHQCILKSNDEHGVLVFVDLYGASPFSTVGSLIPEMSVENIPIRVVTGLNLPMLIEAAMLKESMELDDLYKHIMSSGKEGILELRETLGL